MKQQSKLKSNKEKQKNIIPQRKNNSKVSYLDLNIKQQIIILSLIITLTFIFFFPSLNNKFTNWDDEAYVLNDPLIENLNFESLKNLFTQYYLGNYHPINLLTYAIEFKIWGTNPFPYHFNNLILHLFNVTLLFIFFKKLTNRLLLSFVATSLFAIHPLHVESITWISERKDVLYSFFYIASMIAFLNYKTKTDYKWYAFALMLFVLSCLSKGMAVTLTFSIVLADYLKTKNIDKKFFIDKIPFVIISLIFGIIAIHAQRSGGASDFGKNVLNVFTVGDKMLFSNYSFFIYIQKLFIPINLSTLYPYPSKIGDTLPSIYYLAPLFNIAFFSLLVYAFIKRNKELLFGLLFFVLCIAPMIQIMSVGAAIAADRYFYISSIGLFYLFGYYAEKIKNIKLSIAVFTFIFIMLGIFTFNQTKVWYNSETLWTNVMQIYPENELPYWYRGVYYYNNKENDKVVEDFTKVISLNPTKAEAYSTRGSIYKTKGMNDLALNDFNQVVKLQPDDFNAYIQRGSLLMNTGRNKEALDDYKQSVRLNPNYYSGYMNLGIINSILGNFDSAGIFFNKAIQLEPNVAEVYSNRANYNDMINNLEAALSDYENALRINPNLTDVYTNRASVFFRRQMYKEAIADYTKYISIVPSNPNVYYRRAQVFNAMGDKQSALADIEKAKSLGLKIE
ncbi:MAG: hypothetical protein A2X02_09290 [Bacteroidetes bacterium GWF2_29_10]|nr:MAG: hypothetical protein A2X02_09290 [Bacteroidetes bacterium GWF2_29_10]